MRIRWHRCTEDPPEHERFLIEVEDILHGEKHKYYTFGIYSNGRWTTDFNTRYEKVVRWATLHMEIAFRWKFEYVNNICSSRNNYSCPICQYILEIHPDEKSFIGFCPACGNKVIFEENYHEKT